VRVIELEIPIEAPIERVWKALVAETAKWWRRDFYTSNEAKRFVIEPVLGGRMYEDWGDGAGVVWATVNAVKAPRCSIWSASPRPPGVDRARTTTRSGSRRRTA
jgi:uncharacterized protein YndB with AHSA1/START domain